MAINPDILNLIDIKGLSQAFSPDTSWVLAIQNPSSGVINYITAADLRTVLGANTDYPDGVVTGLDITIDNTSTPKVATISSGTWRISNVTYQTTTANYFNIDAAGASDRIDAIIADNTGNITYVSNYTSLSAGQILVISFTVPSSGADIVPGAVLKSNTAFMNSTNVGDFIVNGNFILNGNTQNQNVIFTIIKSGSDVVDGGIDISGYGFLPGFIISGKYIDVDGEDMTQNCSYNSNTQILFGGFTGSETLITIKITL